MSGTKVFARLCPTHRTELQEGPRDTLICRAAGGHRIEDGRWITGSRTVPERHGTEETKAMPTKKVMMTQGFHTRVGARLFISLERATMIPFRVMARHVDGEGNSRTGVLDSATQEGEAEEKFKQRVAAAVKKGWSLGNPRQVQRIIEIPGPDEKVVPAPKRRAKA